MGLAKEIVESLDTMRMQQNIDRKFRQQDSTGIKSGCMDSSNSVVSEGVYKINHKLGREPIGFMLVEQASASSLYCEVIENPTGQPVDSLSVIFLKFTDKSQENNGVSPPGTPGVFRVFLY